mmetsp:Transcript_17151/g.48981  ORF Transcript_17151/g.48981 Transcript_17151/m.48981 type:complete len:616 (+) Transcript_17151:69-1916(+)
MVWDVVGAYLPRTLFVAWLLGLLLGGHRVFRVPILLLMGAILGAEVAAYFLLRWLVKLAEMIVTARLLRRQSLERQLHSAQTFRAWSAAALELDRHEGRDAWKNNPASRDCHPAALGAAVAKIRKARLAEDVDSLMEHLRFALSWNFGGYMNAALYSSSHVGTKALVHEFVDEVEEGLAWLSRSATAEQAEQVSRCADFVHDAGTAFGSTCLFMSGGAALGFYHFGILRAMLADHTMPNLICGTSMGSIVAGYIATRSDEEALQELTAVDDLYHNIGEDGGPMQGSKLERLWHVVTRGYCYTHEHMTEHLQWFTKGLTFLEAYQLTGRSVSITCTPTRSRSGKMPTMILNHLNAPNVLLHSAIMASSCVPGLTPPVRLHEKVNGEERPWQFMSLDSPESPTDGASGTLQDVLMRDGTFENDVPIAAMSKVFNIHFSVVSQVNPHIIPFFYHPTGVGGRPIRFPWRKYRGGFLVHLLEVWLKEDMTKNLTILQKTGLLFNVLGVDWSYLFTQQDHGEITIVPNAQVYDYFHVMDNVQSREHFVRMLRHSEQNTWQNFTQLSFRTRLQRALRRVAETVLDASSASPPGIREAVQRRCAPVHAEHFRIRGAQRKASKS